MYTENLIKKIAKKEEIDISKFDMSELVMGMDVELEHGSVNPETDVTGDDPVHTFKIVIAHMNESPKYYTKLKEMESKENISEYAKRMRELAGFSEGNKSKSLKTVQTGESSFENASTFMATDMFPKSNSGMIKEGVNSDDDFEVHEFSQKKIEESDEDEELYNLSENTIIRLDFIDED